MTENKERSPFRELLLQTESCDECGGKGRVTKEIDVTGEAEKQKVESMCPKCIGAGAVLDGRMFDAIVKRAHRLYAGVSPDDKVNRMAVCDIIEEIFDLLEDKVEDSYKRGIQDGISEAARIQSEAKKQ